MSKFGMLVCETALLLSSHLHWGNLSGHWTAILQGACHAGGGIAEAGLLICLEDSATTLRPCRPGSLCQQQMEIVHAKSTVTC